MDADRSYRAWLDRNVADLSEFDRRAPVGASIKVMRLAAAFERNLAELKAAAERTGRILDKAMKEAEKARGP